MLSSRDRVERFFEPGSIVPIGSWSSAGPSLHVDDVLTAIGHVDGRRVACYAHDGQVAAGAIGEAQADAIVRLLRIANGAGLPVVSFVHCAGARIEDGVGALAGLGRVFSEHVALLRRLPQISVVTGPSAGGGAYAAALTDFVVMTEQAAMFLTGPGVVARACGERLSAAELGGPRVHARNGVCDLIAHDDDEALSLARRLLSCLAPDAGGRTIGVPELSCPWDPSSCLPSRAAAYYDVADVARALVDDGELLEVSPRWARNVFVAFARLGGRPVGVVANQPSHLGGVLDVAGAEKAARFVERCDAHRVPLVVLVDTPGFMPGSRQEQAGIIYRGARLVEAFVRASVPRATVVLRKAYGGAYIAMNAKHLGATLTAAWPDAEIGIMGAREAVRVAHGRRLARSADAGALEAELAERYADEHCRAAAAQARGFVDRVIEPARTREFLWEAIGGRSAIESPLQPGAVA